MSHKRPGGILQEEILHDVCVVLTAAVREVAGCKHNDGVQTLTIITCENRGTCIQYDDISVSSGGNLFIRLQQKAGFVFINCLNMFSAFS